MGPSEAINMSAWGNKACTLRETCNSTTIIEQPCPLQADHYAFYVGITVLVGLLTLSAVLHLLMYLQLVEVKSTPTEAQLAERRRKAKGQARERVSLALAGEMTKGGTQCDESVLSLRDDICESVEDMRAKLMSEVEMELRAARQDIEGSLRKSLVEQSVELS
jgi:biopolymer transport protein ExbB/TolQ